MLVLFDEMMETTFTCLEWLNYYKEEIRKIKNISPFLSVLCISVGIEFLGKLLNNAPLDSKSDCGRKFEYALSTFSSLNKYAGKKLYNLLRSGLAHRISVKENIIISSIEENQLNHNPVTINTNTLFEDFVEAVEAALSKTDWDNSDVLNSYICINDGSTGSTITMLNL